MEYNPKQGGVGVGVGVGGTGSGKDTGETLRQTMRAIFGFLV